MNGCPMEELIKATKEHLSKFEAYYGSYASGAIGPKLKAAMDSAEALKAALAKAQATPAAPPTTN